MRLAYRPTFNQFTDNYLATHYSSGVQTLRRIAGGPALILIGALLLIAARAWVASVWLRIPAYGVGFLLIFFGIFLAAMPLVNILLVWLRREQLFGPEQPPTVLELQRGHLKVTERGESVRLPLGQIQSVQHRAASTWILTKTDSLIDIPREHLVEGDHDAFIMALEEKIAPPAEDD
jgi:hypothetical protein